MLTGDPTLDLVIKGIFGLFAIAAPFEIAVLWLRSSLHSKGSLSGD